MSRQVSWLMGLQREHREYRYLDFLCRSCLQPSRRSRQWLGWQAASQLQWRDRAGFSPDFPDAFKNPKNTASSINTASDCQDSEYIRVNYIGVQSKVLWSD